MEFMILVGGIYAFVIIKEEIERLEQTINNLRKELK